MNILCLNAGSNSLKFQIVAAEPGNRAFGRSLLAGSYEDIGKKQSSFALLQNKRPRDKQQLEVRDHGHAAELLIDWLNQRNGVSIHRIAHRVVHGADLFDAPARITPTVIQQIESLQDLAPLHNASALKVIHAAEKADLPMFAVFDTAFHRAIPDRAALYAIPPDLAERHKIRRYGFHGISHGYLLTRYAELTGRPKDKLNLITLHLEGGSSAAAILAGKSVDTSMGFTPLEGLMMGTRAGDLDPAIVTFLMRKENLDSEGIEEFLNKKCGLLGVSGVSADTRELCRHLDEPRAKLALNLFSYRVTKYIGAYLAALGGAEAIVFGGGIGENTSSVRENICDSLAWCGAVLDRKCNREADDRETRITTPESRLQIWVIPTEEGLMMAREVAECA